MASTGVVFFYFRSLGVIIVGPASSEARGIEAFILHGGELTCGRTRLWCPQGRRQKANRPFSKVSLGSPSHFLHCLVGRLDLEPHTHTQTHMRARETGGTRGRGGSEESSHDRWHLYRINHSYQREGHSALRTDT